MSDVKLGQTPPEGARRDAVHVAVVPCVAGRAMEAGQKVLLIDGKGYPCESISKSIGVVDPWCGGVSAGGRFWLCLKPGTITGLRHVWTHPAFTDTPQEKVAASKAWLEEVAERYGTDYHTMLHYMEQDDYINKGEDESYKDMDYEEFANHAEIVTGKRLYPPFTCAC